MIQRCSNPNDAGFPDYGGRGIKVCDYWLYGFEAYFADTGEQPPGMLLDRIDNDGNYEPGNCRWATPKLSNDNKRRQGRLPIDLSGQRFGRLVVTRFLRVEKGHARFLCLCDCGTEVAASGSNLKGGSVASCGCLRRQPFLAVS